jgi:drug/metabolite transporter (DMT)-like permease
MNGLYFLILGVFWSFSFLAIKISVTVLPALLAAFVRVLIAGITLSLLFLAQRQNLRTPWASLWRLWGVGVLLQGLPFALLFWGECYVSPALASIINSTVSIWALVFGIVIFRDYSQATWAKMLGLLFGMIGVGCIFMPLLGGGTGQHLMGVIAILVMAMSYGFGALLNQRFCKSSYRVSFQVGLWHQHCGSLLFLTIVMLAFGHHTDFEPLFQGFRVWIALLYLGVFSTAIAWMIYYRLIVEWGAVRASSVMFFVPILTILWDRIFMEIRPNVQDILGVVFILLGVALIQFFKAPASGGVSPICQK